MEHNEKIDSFLKELTELTYKHGITIDVDTEAGYITLLDHTPPPGGKYKISWFCDIKSVWPEYSNVWSNLYWDKCKS